MPGLAGTQTRGETGDGPVTPGRGLGEVVILRVGAHGRGEHSERQVAEVVGEQDLRCHWGLQGGIMGIAVVGGTGRFAILVHNSEERSP